MAKYTYFLDFGAGNVAIIPDKDAVYGYKEEGREDGFMRKHIDNIVISKDFDNAGSFTNATPFDTLWEYYFDITKHQTEITLQIKKNAVLDYTSTFYILDGDIDVNNGVYTIKPTTNDTYKVLLSVGDDEVDVIDDSVGTIYTAELSHTTVVQTDTPGGNPLPAPVGSWVETNVVGTYGRQKSLYDNGAGIFYQGYYYIPEFDGTVASPNPLLLEFEFPNCFKLIDVIQFILDTILAGTSLAGTTFVSNFFNDAFNYVTEEVNTLMNTLIEQRSDTKDPDATNKAHIGKISFNDLMKDLKAMLDVFWFIDDDGDFRIEHRSFFENGLSISPPKTIGIYLPDSGKYVDPSSGKLYIEDSQNFEKADTEKIKTETIKFLDEDTTDFRSDYFYIEYDVVTDSASKREHNVAFFSTDVAKAINNPDNLQDEGFYMFNCEVPIGTTAQIITRLQDYTAPTAIDNIANAAFGTKWLLHDYYEYGRYSKNGTLNLVAGSTTEDTFAVISSSPILIQKDIVFLLNDNDTININKYIAIYLRKSDGTLNVIKGSVINLSHDLHDDMVTVTLGFEL